jgi:hypothetical protein
VVVYCAYGFHVGRNTASTLREAGFAAKYMNGVVAGVNVKSSNDVTLSAFVHTPTAPAPDR